MARKALAKEQGDRYPTVEELRRDIERYQEGRSVSARVDTKWEMLRKFVKRNKGFSTGIAMTLLVLVSCLVILTRAWLATNRAYADYRQSQEEKREQAKKSVPALVRAARLAINERRLEDALTQTSVALDFDPDSRDARLLRAQLRIARQEYADAGTDLRELLRQQPGDADAQRLATLCDHARKDDWTTLLGFVEVLERSRIRPLADVVLANLKSSEKARQKQLEIYRRRIEAAWKGWGRYLTLGQDFTFNLSLVDAKVSDVSPLEGIPLTNLILVRDEVRDLSPLKGMLLTTLNLFPCRQVRDPSLLKGMPLTNIHLPLDVDRGMNELRSIKTLATINDMPADDFWKKYDAGELKQYRP